MINQEIEQRAQRENRFLLKREHIVWVTIFLIAITILLATSHDWNKTADARAVVPPPTEVEVVAVEQRDVQIYSEWIGTLDGMVNTEIKAQVSGYLLNKNYVEGSYVKKDQLLFEIDPRPFQTALDQAKGDLAKAQAQLLQAEGQLAQSNSQLLQAQAQLTQSEANQHKTQLDVDRYTNLVKDGVVARQDYDNAVQINIANQAQVKAAIAGIETAQAQIKAAKAGVEMAKAIVQSASAAVKTAELNLSFTQITAPIDGIAGIAQAQVGNLVGPNSGMLTMVSTVDPIKVYFTLSEQEYLNYTTRDQIQNKWGADDRKLELELVLANGATHPQKGHFFVADLKVDQKIGAIRLAGIFPNPGNVLRPGQYARVRAITNMKKNALLIPQRSVTELQGNYQVAIVSSDNKVSIQSVKVGERNGSMWIIEEGLNGSEKVVVEGTQKVRSDMVVNPKPFVEPVPATAR
ncbi:MAG: efflux RND transporter periplasmic adaptor subunit [Acidobacteriota bacterium]